MRGRCCHRVAIVLFAMIIALNLYGQKEQYGLWLNVQLDKKVNKWQFELSSELRTVYYLRLIERGSIKLTTDYSLSKAFEISAEYALMNTLDAKYKNYQIRHRAALGFGYDIEFGDVKLEMKEKVRITTKDESKRISESGAIDTYRVNPEVTWVNSLQLEYNIPKSKWTPLAQFSTYYTLNDTAQSSFDNLRYKLGIDYKISKRSNANMYLLLNSDQESDDNYGKYILGFGFNHTIK